MKAINHHQNCIKHESKSDIEYSISKMPALLVESKSMTFKRNVKSFNNRKRLI